MKTVYPDENNVVLNENSAEKKPCINRESKSDEITIKLYSCHNINTKFLVVVTPPSIYHINFHCISKKVRPFIAAFFQRIWRDCTHLVKIIFLPTPLPQHLLLPHHVFTKDNLLLHYLCTAGCSLIAIAYKKLRPSSADFFKCLLHDYNHLSNPNYLPPLSPATSSFPIVFCLGRFTTALLLHCSSYIMCHCI